VANIPSRIGNFEVLRQIGSGGMGAVYLGRDAELNRQVAIKVIREEVHDQEVLDRFFREARAAAALRHPNIITIYASGQHDHQPYIAMEFVDGESLADVIRKRKQLTLAEKLTYLDQICAGLHFAHKAGIVHRDIKPANIMIDSEGTVRILDFGIARIEGSAMTQDGALIGSLNYMSPEQMLGRPVDLRSDIFSVGSLAYELISYHQAFKGSLNDGLLQRLPNEHPPALTQIYPGLPAAVERVVMRALEKAPDNRYQTLSDMRAALSEAQGNRAASAPVEEERTLFIPRGGVPSSTGTGLPPSQIEPPMSSAVSVIRGNEQFGEPTLVTSSAPPPSPVAGTATPIPWKPATIGLKPPAPTVIKPAPTITKPPSTVSGPATTKPRPATATVVPRPPAAAASSRKWIVVGSVVAGLIVAAAGAIPFLREEPAGIERERPAIVDAMGRFRMAYRNRDINGVVAVFPTLPREIRQTMQKTFDACLVYEVTFADLQVAWKETAPTQAEVDVRSTHTCTPNSNARQTTTAHHDVFLLRKNGENWVIDSVAPVAASTSRTQ
jgi:serine/threonine-protein kinase